MPFRNLIQVFAIILIGSVLPLCVGAPEEEPETPPSTTLATSPAPSVKLKIPVVQQERLPLSSAACMEMIFRYWGEQRYSQYDIARALVWKYRDNKRYVKSHTLFQIRSGKSAEEMDWSSFTGTGTHFAGEFLKSLARTANPRVQSLPRDPGRAQKIEDRYFQDLKLYLSSGVPVIVHQWLDGEREDHLFRLVTGYDESKQIVHLNDPIRGSLEMSYRTFLYLWKVDQDWLAYHYIAFNVPGPEQMRKGEMQLKLDLPQ